MPSERVLRRIETLLDEADQAIAASEWERVRDRANNVLALDPDNVDARDLLSAARRALEAASPDVVAQHAAPGRGGAAQHAAQLRSDVTPVPTSFANGRYEVRRFLGEGGKKRVYLAHDTLLDRDVAFALIKTEGLDDAARTRITREAQAMGRRPPQHRQRLRHRREMK